MAPSFYPKIAVSSSSNACIRQITITLRTPEKKINKEWTCRTPSRYSTDDKSIPRCGEEEMKACVDKAKSLD
jgi:hypothetical protein